MWDFHQNQVWFENEAFLLEENPFKQYSVPAKKSLFQDNLN